MFFSGLTLGQTSIWRISHIFPAGFMQFCVACLDGFHYTCLNTEDTDEELLSIPTLPALIFVCKCHPQSQSHWTKTSYWGSYGTGISPKPWMRLSHRCPNQETACKYEVKIGSQQLSEKDPKAQQKISYKHHKSRGPMEIVDVKSAGRPQDKSPLTLPLREQLGNCLQKGEPIKESMGKEHTCFQKTCQDSNQVKCYVISRLAGRGTGCQ